MTEILEDFEASAPDVYVEAMVAEGEWELAGVEPNEGRWLSAMRFLVASGIAWEMPGRIRRQARDLIEAGLIEV